MKSGKEQSEPNYPDGLQDLCDQLEPLHHQLSVCVENKLKTKTEVAAVIKLESLKNTEDIPMFLTWPAHRFGETWSTITNAFEQELILKDYIKENIAHTPNEDNRLFYITAWVNQPYITSGVEAAVEALLKETGHR